MAVHLTECVFDSSCVDVYLTTLTAPLQPPPNLCHVCCLYDDKFSTVVTLVTLSEDWWSSETGDPSPLHWDFRNLFLITPHGRGRAGNDPLSARRHRKSIPGTQGQCTVGKLLKLWRMQELSPGETRHRRLSFLHRPALKGQWRVWQWGRSPIVRGSVFVGLTHFVFLSR